MMKNLILKRYFAIIISGPIGKEAPLDEFLRHVLAGIIAGLIVHCIISYVL
jgi:hypothetical protein